MQPPKRRLEPPQLHVISWEKHSARFSWEKEEEDLDGWLVTFKLEIASSPDFKDFKLRYTGDENECEVQGLSSGQSYLARMRIVATPLQADSSHAEGPLSEPMPLEICPDPSCAVSFTTLPSSPSAPAPPSLASREKKALKLKWSQPQESGGTEPLSYILYCSPPPLEPSQVDEGSIKTRAIDATAPESFPCDSEGFAEVYNGLDKSHKVTRLQPGVRYTFRLKASNSLGTSPVSMCSSFTTQASVPSPPEAPVVLTTSSNSISLVWWPPQDNGSPITSYLLEVDQGKKVEGSVNTSSHISNFELAYSGTATTATVNNLKHGLLYSFRLLAENAEGRSLWSSLCTSSTSAVPPDPPSLLFLKGQPTLTSCAIAWNSPHDHGGSKVEAYEVQIQAKVTAAIELMGSEWMTIFNGTVPGCEINCLRPGCSYRCRVRAKNSAGWGLFGIPIDIATAANIPDAPQEPTATSLLPRSISIKWDPPNYNGGSTVTEYTVMVAQSVPCSCSQCPLDTSQLPKSVLSRPCDKSLPGNFASQTVAGHVLTMDIEDLLPNQHYFVRVQATNPIGASEWSQWERFLTAPDRPGPPGQPQSSPAGPGALTLTWTPPDEDHGSPVHTFVVEMAPEPDSFDLKHSLADEGGDGMSSKGTHTPDEGSSDPLTLRGFKMIYQGPAKGCEARGLPPASAFIFRVRAINEAGASEWSLESKPTFTLPSTPGPVHAFTVVSLLTLPSPSPSPPAPSSRHSASQSVGSNSPRSSSNDGVIAEVIDPPAPTSLGLPLNPTRCIQVSWAPPINSNGSPVACYSVEMAPLGRLKVNSQMSVPPVAPGPPFSLPHHKRSSGPSHPPPLSSPMTSASYPLPSSMSPQALHWSVVYSGPSTGCIVDRLPPGRSYAFRVRASNQMGWGLLCEPMATTTLPGAPSPPLRLTATPLSGQQAKSEQGRKAQAQSQVNPGSCLRVKWEPSLDDHGAPLLSYLLELAEARSDQEAEPGVDPSSSLQWKEVYRGPETQTRLTDLSPGQPYWLRVRACNAAGVGEASDPFHAITSLSPPSPPSQVTVSILPLTHECLARKDKGTSFSAEVTWSSPEPSPHSALPIGFEVLLLPTDSSSSQGSSENNNKGSIRVNVGKGEQKATVAGLSPSQSFTVRLRAVGAEGAGHSLWSPDVKFTTPRPPLPPSFSQSSLTALVPPSSTEESEEASDDSVLPVVSHASVSSAKGQGQGQGPGNKSKVNKTLPTDLSSTSPAPLATAASIPPSSSHTPPLARRVVNSTSRTWKAWKKVQMKRINAWVRAHSLKILAFILVASLILIAGISFSMIQRAFVEE